MTSLEAFNNFLARPKNYGLSVPSEEAFAAFCGGIKAASGEHVNERTAMGLSAYLACIKNISEDVGKLPFSLYKRLKPRGRQSLDTHPVSRLIHDEPNPEMSAMTFRETITQHALGWHGGFAEIVRNGGGRPEQLWPLDPNCVQVMRDKEPPYSAYYWVHGWKRFEITDILHIHGLGYDGLTGYVLSRVAKDPIGNALAAQNFSGEFYANGITTSGVLTLPDAMSEKALANLRASFEMRHGRGEHHRPLILEQGATWTNISNSPRDSQMVEVLEHGDEEICGLFRMPPHKIGRLKRSTNNNIEQQALEYVVDCLLGWLVRWEQEGNKKLLMPSEKPTLYSKHCVEMLLRGDMTARSTFYREQFNIGAMSSNDVRELEDRNPIEGGDAYFVNATMVPLDMAAEGEHIGTNAPSEPQPPKPNGRPPGAKRDLLLESIGELLQAELTALLRLEHDKVARASKKANFAEWAADFYGKTHREAVSTRLKPIVSAFCVTLDADDQSASILESVVNVFIERSLKEMRDEASSSRWVDGSRAEEDKNILRSQIIASTVASTFRSF